MFLDFEDGLKNQGVLGGAGQFRTYAAGEEPSLDHSVLGRCLDLTAASRHGGMTDAKTGGAVVFRHAALDKLDTFTVTLWHRQNPLVQGQNARLLTKENAWDLMPQAGGVSLGMGPGAQKVIYPLTGKSKENLAGKWRFTAIVVERKTVFAYTGGIGQPLMPCAAQPRQEQAATAGDLVLGTLGGIRPFNGWLDRVRVFGEPLDEAAVRAIYAGDRAAAQESRPTPVYDLARPPAGTHRFQFKRSDIPFSTRWQKRTEAPGVMQSFHTTQCLWVYGSDPQFIDFQVESMRAFFRDFRRQLDEWSPNRYIPVTVNSLLDRLHPNYNLCGVDVVDGFVGESSQNADYQTAAGYLFAAKAAEAFGITQVVSPIPRSTARTRAALATTYALGQTHLVPWDLYMGSDATGIQPRHFGTREQYGDLYDFIHEHAALLDAYEPIAEVGVLANADALSTDSLAQFCHRLAQQHIPFHLLLGASQSARVPLRAADLRAVRLVVEFSPAESFCEADQRTLREARESGVVRFLPPTADLAAACRFRGLDLLRIEGPEGLYAFPRVHPAPRSAAVHVVNWNLGPDGERCATYRHVTLTLLTPPRWGRLASATYHQPGQKPVALEPELHEDCVRLTLPQIETWGIVEIRPGRP